LLLRISALFLAFVFAFADVRIFATKAKDENGTIILKNPLVFYNDSIIQAQQGTISQNRDFVLKGKVLITYKNSSSILTNELRAKINKKISMRDIYFYDRTFDGWIKAKKSHSENKTIFFRKLYFSTCCVKNPDWYIKASRAKYNREKKDLKLYNITLVVNRVPVFYLPYFYVNFDKTRRSGFLRPYIGYSQNEGFLYSQPIYFVTSVNTDLEITPTIRTQRGKGVYGIFRFVDSPNSKGSIKAGVFDDYYNYFVENNLANKNHYGLSLNYQRSNMFLNSDALYVDLKYANDVDYFYLDAYNYRFNDTYLSDKLITSNINYIKTTNAALYGMYMKYFIDTTKVSNSDTWQILPEINYHKYLSKNHGIMNLLDFSVYNYYRKSGSNFVLGEMLFPVSINKTFLNDYLKIKLTETLSAGYGYYYQENSLKSKYLNLNTQIKLYTSLTKKADYLHIISPSLTLNLKNYSKNEIYTDLMTPPNVDNSLSFNLFQIYEKNETKITHTMTETYYLSRDDFADLENILNIKFYSFEISENNKYAIKKNYVTYNNAKFSYNNKPFYYFISHVYQKDVSKSVILGASYNLNDYKKLYTEYNYDLNNKYTKYWLVGVNLNKKCWKYDISFKHARVPVLEEDGISYRSDMIVSLSVSFNPIGGLNQTFVFKGKK